MPSWHSEGNGTTLEESHYYFNKAADVLGLSDKIREILITPRRVVNTLAILIRERIGDQADPLMVRLASSTQATCDRLTRILGSERSDAQLVDALNELLPPETE